MDAFFFFLSFFGLVALARISGTTLNWGCCSVPKPRLTLCDTMDRGTPGFPALHCFPEFARNHVHWVSELSNHLVLCQLLLLPSIFPSIRVFSNELVLHIRQPKYSSFSFGISPSSEYLGLISFRIDWFALLAVQGTLKSLLQHHNLKASILWHSAFFIAKLSHLYMTTGKTIPLTLPISVSKVMSLSRFVTAFLPRSERLLISWLQSPSAVNTGGESKHPYFLPELKGESFQSLTTEFDVSSGFLTSTLHHVEVIKVV